MFRKNVAGQNIPFVLLKAADGTALTGATVATYRCIDGAAQVAVTGTVTEKANGQYLFAPSQADMNGNQIGFLFTAATAIPVHITIVTTAADPTNGTTFGLANLDAAISTRSTYAGGAVASVTAGVTVSDKTGFSLATAPPTAAQNRTEMDTNSTKLANLDAAVTTRLATAGYTAPDNAGVTAIKAKTDQLLFTTGTVNANATVDAGAIAVAVSASISIPTPAQIDSQLSASHGAGGWGSSAVGGGSTPVTITVNVNSLPVDGVAVYVSTDAAGANVSAGALFTDAFGKVNFMLDPGAYYVFKQRSGYNFTNPESITVTP